MWIVGLVQEDRMSQGRRMSRIIQDIGSEVDGCARARFVNYRALKSHHPHHALKHEARTKTRRLKLKRYFGFLPPEPEKTDPTGFHRMLPNRNWTYRIACTVVASCIAVAYSLQTTISNDQRLVVGYWLLLSSMIAILITTPRWRGHSKICCIKLSYFRISGV